MIEGIYKGYMNIQDANSLAFKLGTPPEPRLCLVLQFSFIKVNRAKLQYQTQPVGR